jgi:hypothetical protein
LKQLSALVIAFLLILGVPAYADDGPEHAQPADLAAQKQLLDEARSFLRAARASMEKWDRVPDQLGSAVYYAGVKDGALGAAVALVVIYLIFLHRKTP